MTHPIHIDAIEVARLIGFNSRAAFLKHRDRLEYDQDFPLPVPTCQRPLKWRRDQVLAWHEKQGRPRSVPTMPIPGGNVVLMEKAATV